jgi:hypothetical protein
MHSIAMVVRTSSCVLYAAKTSPSILAIPRAAYTAMPHSTVTSFKCYKSRHAFVSDRPGVDIAIAIKITVHCTIDVFLRDNIISINR